MSANFSISGDNVEVSFAYIAEIAKVQAVVDDASELLFDRGLGEHGDEENVILFADLSNADKLAILDGYVLQTIVGLANSGKLQKAQELARELEEENKHVL